MSAHSSNTATISVSSAGVSPWTGFPPGLALSKLAPDARRPRQRSTRRGDTSKYRHASRADQPPVTAPSTRPRSETLVAASILLGTRPLNPKALFPLQAST
jgi:hypothetical protein